MITSIHFYSFYSQRARKEALPSEISKQRFDLQEPELIDK